MKIAVLGAGPGGYVAALKAAQMGAEVTVIENEEVGGTCLNKGCIPTKTMLASSELYSKVKELSSFGFDLNGEVVPNMEKIIERKRKVVDVQVKGIKGLFRSWGVELKNGRGELVSDREIRISKAEGGETVTADRIIVATGSRPAEIPTFPYDGKNIISSTEALELDSIPKSLLIVGAGVIGCEFACIFRELGTEVTIVELLPRAVATEDEEISRLLERELKKKKIKLFTGVKAENVEVKEDGVHTVLSNGREIISGKVLVSIGRAFNSDGIGLEAVGVEKGPRGDVRVNNRMETSLSGIYAIGDVTGGVLLAHVASKEGLVAVGNIMGTESVIDYSVVPAAIFTSPEIASVGLREHQASERGIEYLTGHFQFRALGKAHAMGEISGMIKVIAEKDTDRLLGVHIIGPHASDLIHEAAVALKAGLKVKDIADTIHAHPTLSEGLMEAAEDVHGEAVHVPRK
ncbi:dihydrolipoyl dehydrogenase [bacterium BMS3Bbin06]|nr:dihydrolipoyl dehydrogenase [bacterium BMS3Abin08]GBE33943.1 dihydrolipoyl dehydrogenase [bacterium BMS3Bbin06]HDO36555.1 dihydrolipoyl dehydrogenase [Nitrospirota bacterium]HDY70806.1 dihydrolipoyl dehydrogenase [Nitrospirota bacterium]